jgi:hypothetical protein
MDAENKLVQIKTPPNFVLVGRVFAIRESLLGCRYSSPILILILLE